MNYLNKCIFCILILISFIRCEEVEKDFNYIQVTATGKVFTVFLENNTLYMDKIIAGVPVDMELVKAGGERLHEIGTTGSDGSTSITTVFNLYKEQPIEFIARLVNSPDQIKKDKLTWDQADEFASDDGKGSLRTMRYTLNVTFGIPQP